MAGFRKWQCVQKMAVPVRGGGWGVGGMGYVRVMLVYMCVSGRGGGGLYRPAVIVTLCSADSAKKKTPELPHVIINCYVIVMPQVLFTVPLGVVARRARTRSILATSTRKSRRRSRRNPRNTARSVIPSTPCQRSLLSTSPWTSLATVRTTVS